MNLIGNETPPVFHMPLCRFDDLPDGDSRGFDPAGEGRDTMFVVRRGERLHGWRNACPHIDGAPMAWRKDAYLNADRSRIVCHAHGAQFDIETGVCTLGPCLGQALEPVRLRSVPAGDGVAICVVMILPSVPQNERDNADSLREQAGRTLPL